MISSFKRKRTLALGVLLLLFLSAGAVAYFTAAGSGSGSASVGTTANVVLHGTTTGTLYPGTSVTVNLTADNPNSAKAEVGTVQLTGIRACSGAGSTWTGNGCSNGGTEVKACEDLDPGSAADADASDFYMANVAENQELPANSTGNALANAGTLTMNDLTRSQDQCQGVNLYLQLTS
jgi:hypothetical protein